MDRKMQPLLIPHGYDHGISNALRIKKFAATVRTHESRVERSDLQEDNGQNPLTPTAVTY
jgi:hypothetical protein